MLEHYKHADQLRGSQGQGDIFTLTGMLPGQRILNRRNVDGGTHADTHATASEEWDRVKLTWVRVHVGKLGSDKLDGRSHVG